jgi:uncharacterized protein (TIGR03000 family)
MLVKAALCAAALMFATAAVEARPGHGGGGHGGGGHGGGGHGGGFHGGSFHGGGFHGGNFHGGNFHHGNFNRGFAGGWGGWGWGYPGWGYGWGGYYPNYYGYNDYYPDYSSDYPYYYSNTTPYYSDYTYAPTASDYQSFYPPDGSTGAAAANNTALIRIRTAPDAQLWFDGTATTQTGPVRTFTTPQLTPGKEYEYKVRVRWTENGELVEKTKNVDLTPGRVINVDMTPTAMK